MITYTSFWRPLLPLLYYVQNTTIGILLVLTMLYYVLGQGGKRQPQDSLFIYLLFSVLVLLILELLMDVCSGRSFTGARFGNISSTFLFYLIMPSPGLMYFLYIDQLQQKWVRMPVKLGLLVAIPMHINTVLVIISLFNGMLFSIDASNTYHRGPFIVWVVILNFSYLLMGQIHAIRQYLKNKKRSIPFLVFFPYPIVFAAFLQLFSEHMSLLLVTLTLTLLMVYLRIQNSRANKDFLTSLYNRSIGEEYLKHLYTSGSKHSLIGGMLMDIDGFKWVNDTFGHDFGDKCLRSFSRLLVDSFPRSWLICRYGGDEFLLVRSLDAESEMEEDMQTFLKSLEQFNMQKKLPFPLGISIGKGFAEEIPDGNSEAFLKLLDGRMYQDKAEHRILEEDSLDMLHLKD